MKKMDFFFLLRRECLIFIVLEVLRVNSLHRFVVDSKVVFFFKVGVSVCLVR